MSSTKTTPQPVDVYSFYQKQLSGPLLLLQSQSMAFGLEFPCEIYFEINAALDHLARRYSDPPNDESPQALAHLRRCFYDTGKLVGIWTLDKLETSCPAYDQRMWEAVIELQTSMHKARVCEFKKDEGLASWIKVMKSADFLSEACCKGKIWRLEKSPPSTSFSNGNSPTEEGVYKYYLSHVREVYSWVQSQNYLPKEMLLPMSEAFGCIANKNYARAMEKLSCAYQLGVKRSLSKAIILSYALRKEKPSEQNDAAFTALRHFSKNEVFDSRCFEECKNLIGKIIPEKMPCFNPNDKNAFSLLVGFSRHWNLESILAPVGIPKITELLPS